MNIDIHDVRKLAQKDWSGNSRDVFTTLGATSHSVEERAPLDLYTTNQMDFVRFLKALRRDNIIDSVIQEPVYENAAGLGHLVEVLQRVGKKVVFSDIEDRSNWETYKKSIGSMVVRDFLDKETPFDFEFNTIITNPPFAKAQEFVERSLDVLKYGQWALFFLRIQWLEGLSRRKLFDKYKYKYVYVYSKRALCSLNGDENNSATGSAVCYAWFCYQKGFEGDPVIKFID